MTTPPATSQPADPEHLPAWRGLRREYAQHAATGAYLALPPGAGWDKAAEHATRAIASASAHQTEWFWRGMR